MIEINEKNGRNILLRKEIKAHNNNTTITAFAKYLFSKGTMVICF